MVGCLIVAVGGCKQDTPYQSQPVNPFAQQTCVPPPDRIGPSIAIAPPSDPAYGGASSASPNEQTPLPGPTDGGAPASSPGNPSSMNTPPTGGMTLVESTTWEPVGAEQPRNGLGALAALSEATPQTSTPAVDGSARVATHVDPATGTANPVVFSQQLGAGPGSVAPY